MTRKINLPAIDFGNCWLADWWWRSDILNVQTFCMPVGLISFPRCLINLSLTDSAQWQQLREFGTPQTQAELDKNLAQLRDRFLLMAATTSEISSLGRGSNDPFCLLRQYTNHEIYQSLVLLLISSLW